MKSFEELMEIFVSNAIRHSEKYVDYGDKKSVREYNKCLERLGKAAEKIDEYYPERKQEFFKLLESDNWDIKRACAHSILECTHYTSQEEEMALGVLHYYADEIADSCAKMLYSLYFSDWAGEKKKIRTVYSKK